MLPKLAVIFNTIIISFRFWTVKIRKAMRSSVTMKREKIMMKSTTTRNTSTMKILMKRQKEN